MFLSLGDAFSVKKSDVVFILDADTASKGRATRAFWKQKEEEGLLIDCSDTLPLSLVLVQERGKEAVLYLSRQKSSTLSARWRTRKGRNELD